MDSNPGPQVSEATASLNLPYLLAWRCIHWTLNYFVRGSIAVWLTSCWATLDSTKLVNLYLIHHKQSSWIQIGQTQGQPYRQTSSYEVNECSLVYPIFLALSRLRTVSCLLGTFPGWSSVSFVSYMKWGKQEKQSGSWLWSVWKPPTSMSRVWIELFSTIFIL